MDIKKIILNDQDKLTSDERDLQMLRAVEKSCGTGPIIGEAREVLISMSRNIMVRDLLLSAMGITTEKSEKIFHEINQMLRDRDVKILAERAKH